ncbi:MAG: hypothetical protein RL204_1682 [Bacteroidota bacterium]|jgi:hypothetical protein
MKQALGSIVIGLAVVIAAALLSNGYMNRNKSENVIFVTGLGSKDFVSDLIVWNASFSRRSMDLQAAYAELNKDREIIKTYLIGKGVSEASIVFASVNIQKEYDESRDNNGNYFSTFAGYSLTQNVTIESNEVDKVEGVSREVTELINQGVELYSQEPQYYYTKLAELKIEMIAAATQDAKVRAEQIAQNSNGNLGGLKNATMGIFQITGQNSSEDYSWGGAFNTSSKRKTASITMRLEYLVD